MLPTNNQSKPNQSNLSPAILNQAKINPEFSQRPSSNPANPPVAPILEISNFNFKENSSPSPISVLNTQAPNSTPPQAQNLNFNSDQAPTSQAQPQNFNQNQNFPNQAPNQNFNQAQISQIPNPNYNQSQNPQISNPKPTDFNPQNPANFPQVPITPGVEGVAYQQNYSPAGLPPQNPNINNKTYSPAPSYSQPSTPITNQNPYSLPPQETQRISSLKPDQLKQEVAQTEVDIQRVLIENERLYREGVSTLRDLISPSGINITSRYLEVGTKLTRSFFVLTYPRIISSGWLSGIVNADIPMDLSIYINPQDSGKVLRELKGKVGKIQASLQINAEKGTARDPALETAYRDVESLRDSIQQGIEKFYKVGVYLTIYADNRDQLDKYTQDVEGLLGQQNIIIKRAALQMDDGFNSNLPLLNDKLDVLTNMNTSPLSAAFPFVSSDLSSDDGILYGINRHNTSLVIFDRFQLENANSLIFATSGAGKSYTVKLEILRSLMTGSSVIVIDPEQEYKVLSDTLGGAYVNMSLNSANRINPFDLPKALAGESSTDVLRSAVIDIIGLMNLMLGKLNPQELAIMEKAILEAYAKRDITPDSDFSKVVVPTMSDLVEILNGIIGGESLAQRLYRYTEGTFAGIFNQRTNININNDFIVFNIRDLQENLRPIAMYILLKFIWNEVRSSLKRRILAIDEAWILMQYEDSARFLYGLAKRARKYYLGITTITQDVGDFLGSPFGKPIVTNAAMKILLKQSTAAIDQIGETFALTSGEKQVLLQSDVGQGIFFAGPRHVAIEIVAFPTEHRLITTDPKDIARMQGLSEGI